jgi:hypothetical protein
MPPHSLEGALSQTDQPDHVEQRSIARADRLALGRRFREGELRFQDRAPFQQHWFCHTGLNLLTYACRAAIPHLCQVSSTQQLV